MSVVVAMRKAGDARVCNVASACETARFRRVYVRESRAIMPTKTAVANVVLRIVAVRLKYRGRSSRRSTAGKNCKK